MNGSLRAKLIAGTGIAAMLVGATLTVMPAVAGAASVEPVVNPGGLDNPSCADLGYEIEAKDNTERNAPYSGTADSGADPDLLVNYDLNIDGTVDFVVDEDSEYLVSAVIIKKGDSNSGGGAHVFEYDPAVSSDEDLATIPSGATSFSHITFCSDTTENTTTTVEETTTTEGEVLGTSTVPDETTTSAAEVIAESVTPAPEVLDNTVTLPKTGSVADRLAPIGIAMMILGAILVGGSRRSLLARD